MELRAILSIVIVTMMFVSLFIPIVRQIAVHIGAIDIPNKRKVHKVPIPRLGGLGIYAGFLLGYLLFGHQSVQMNSILIGSIIVVITGMIDDIKPIPARYKFLGQLVAALIVPIYGGIILKDISFFGVYVSFGIFGIPITVLFIVAIMNCINLSDGLDGLAGGLAAIYFLMIGIIALTLNNGNGLDTLLTFIMLGSTLGFLVHNFNPASIFMGDSGSLFLGYIISVIALLGYKNVTFTSLIVPMFLLMIPIIDTFFAIIRRALKHESITMPDKSHLHHQLLKLNFSPRMAVLIIYFVDILFAIASIIYVLGNRGYGMIIYVIIFLTVFILIVKTDIVSDKKIKPKFRLFRKNK